MDKDEEDVEMADSEEDLLSELRSSKENAKDSRVISSTMGIHEKRTCLAGPRRRLENM
jgi:hypothetical protein